MAKERKLGDMRNSLFPAEEQALKDRLEGWELVDFLDISIDNVLAAAIENDWIHEDNLEDLLEFIGLRS